MAINKSLQWVFIVFNALFALIGIVFAVRHPISLVTEREGGDHASEVFKFLVGGLVAGIAILGIYGAYRQKKWALISFSVLVGIGMVICLVAGVKTVIIRSLYWHCEEDKETCALVNVILDATVGILFGLAIVALIGVTMAIAMTYQIKETEQGTVMAVPTDEYSKPPAYSDIYK